ncbi:NADH-quinone oxidoreductase subunit C [Streptomyces sp. MB22_4]|uniref:NADH-quinone oxidoreductase subunit C n=1 Tax=Streptomyces sp. MB22_4 TaxID=3383120 RepID=UPI0039A04D93
MSTAGWLPAPAEELFGAEAVAEESYEVLTVDIPPSAWLTALETARTTLTCTYFDWLSAVDEPGTGFRVSAHVVALNPVRRLLLRTTVPHSAPVLPSAVGVYAGAAWHERETHEMFGVTFEGHPGLEHLLLPENFEGHPLRKDFVLAARVAKAWPGAKEPGESEHGGPKRRQMLPPGVPDPNEWGPLKGQLPAAPARAAGDRPVRRTRPAAEGSAGRPVATEDTAPARPRRTRSASEGSASQVAGERGEPAAEEGAAGAGAGPAAGAPARPRRTRSASQGSVSQAAGGDAAQAPVEGPAAEAPTAHEPTPAPARPRRARSASEGSASQRAPKPPATETGEEPSGTGGAEPPARRTTPRSSDAPWHHARPAFDEAAEPETREVAERGAVEPHGAAGRRTVSESPEQGASPSAGQPSAGPGQRRSPEPAREPEPADPGEAAEARPASEPLSAPGASERRGTSDRPGAPEADPSSEPMGPRDAAEARPAREPSESPEAQPGSERSEGPEPVETAEPQPVEPAQPRPAPEPSRSAGPSRPAGTEPAPGQPPTAPDHHPEVPPTNPPGGPQ